MAAVSPWLNDHRDDVLRTHPTQTRLIHPNIPEDPERLQPWSLVHFTLPKWGGNGAGVHGPCCGHWDAAERGAAQPHNSQGSSCPPWTPQCGCPLSVPLSPVRPLDPMLSTRTRKEEPLPDLGLDGAGLPAHPTEPHCCFSPPKPCTRTPTPAGDAARNPTATRMSATATSAAGAATAAAGITRSTAGQVSTDGWAAPRDGVQRAACTHPRCFALGAQSWAQLIHPELFSWLRAGEEEAHRRTAGEQHHPTGIAGSSIMSEGFCPQREGLVLAGSTPPCSGLMPSPPSSHLSPQSTSPAATMPSATRSCSTSPSSSMGRITTRLNPTTSPSTRSTGLPPTKRGSRRTAPPSRECASSVHGQEVGLEGLQGLFQP